ENMIMNFYRKIDRKKVQFDFLVHKRTESGFEDEVLSLGGKIFDAPERSASKIFKYVKGLKAFFFEHGEYKVVHCHINTLSVFPLYAAKKSGVPVRISHSHTAKTESGYKAFFKTFLKFFINKFCNFRFACGEEAGRYLFGNRMFENGKVTVLKNGIDCERFSFSEETRERMRKNLMFSEDETVICHVGRFDKYKNQGFIVEILNDLKKNGVNAKALFLGEGEDFEKVKELSKKLGLEKDTVFAGAVPNVSDFLQAADVFVFPSLFEGLPLTLIEAQANGLFVFASDAVSKESDVSETVRFLPLEKGASFWADEIKKAIPFKRSDNIEKIRSAGYDSAQSAEFLQKFYLEKWCL
ncbi:MAG: glycosyltransferase family 1 protein, partial [Clostridia bacterium]|nr:glycosyltransferase family 1 protein [Clostridia bacterium]